MSLVGIEILFNDVYETHKTYDNLHVRCSLKLCLWRQSKNESITMTIGNWLIEHIVVHKQHKWRECVCCCILFSAVLLEALDFPVGGLASETTLAMTGVASPVPAGSKKHTEGSAGDIIDRFHSIFN